MQSGKLPQVVLRMEGALARLPYTPTCPAELMDQWEQLAIAVLDSEYMFYPERVLENYLCAFLTMKRLELGLYESK